MILVVDLGNTRLKWSLVDGDGRLGESRALAWSADVGGMLAEQWLSLPRPSAVWVSSVVDAAREGLLTRLMRERFQMTAHWVSTPHEACGVTSAYAEPATMGVDRFLGLVAAHADQHAPCILVSSGTALVMDALAGDGTHLGGLIAPGARLMEQSVVGATARVRPASAGELTDAATNTADALTSGCWQACAALADRFVEHMRGPLGGTPAVLLGGGDADILEPLMEHAVTRFPDAVLRGLGVWASRHANDE